MEIHIDITTITLSILSTLLLKMEAKEGDLIIHMERTLIWARFISTWTVAVAMDTVMDTIMDTIMAMEHSTISAVRTFMADFYTVFMPRDLANKLVWTLFDYYSGLYEDQTPTDS